MKRKARKTKYTVGEIGRVRVVEDFLPPPDSLVPRKAKKTVKRTAAELREMARCGESKSDWKAAAKKPLPSGRDPDDAMEEIDWVTAELPLPRRKEQTTLRLDADVLDWFRAQGKGYQTRINAILRKYFEQNMR